jgi:hypothetical protein
MSIQNFVRQHYSPSVGESPVGHATAILAGLALVVIGTALIVSVIFVPLGVTTVVLGLFILGAGLFAHIQSPLNFKDLVDVVISLSGAAIAITFALIVAVMVIGMVVTVLVSAFRLVGA